MKIKGTNKKLWDHFPKFQCNGNNVD